MDLESTDISAPEGLYFLCVTELEAHQHWGNLGHPNEPGANCLSLARALAASPAWKEMPGATLVVRALPRPVMGVMGRFDAASGARLAALGPQLGSGIAHLRYVSYSQAEEDCARLADLLTQRFGRDELRRFRFAAIPRGGLIVLGMLSYALGLEHAQLESPYPPDVPLVVVDDCALSGYRFGGFLSRCESRRVIFAHLYSHPDLRAAVEEREPRVAACVGARDLRDHAPENLGAEHEAWRARWLAHFGEDAGYWLGQPDHLCFPWSETDVSAWNPVTERVERGWRVVPPELCLKNRSACGAISIPVQVQPEGKGPLRPSARTLFGEFEGHVVVGNMQTKASFTLAGVAADMWRAIVEHGNLKDAARYVSKEYDVDEATLLADLGGFVGDLLARDLLEQSHALAS